MLIWILRIHWLEIYAVVIHLDARLAKELFHILFAIHLFLSLTHTDTNKNKIVENITETVTFL
jgi:hypothetical protein